MNSLKHLIGDKKRRLLTASNHAQTFHAHTQNMHTHMTAHIHAESIMFVDSCMYVCVCMYGPSPLCACMKKVCDGVAQTEGPRRHGRKIQSCHPYSRTTPNFPMRTQMSIKPSRYNLLPISVSTHPTLCCVCVYVCASTHPTLSCVYVCAPTHVVAGLG